MSAIQLIVGLGNPGPEYEKHRHNIGAMWVTRVADVVNASFSLEPKFKGHLASFSWKGFKGRLLLPTTYMNLSGESIQMVSHFYKIPTDSILVCHDELDLPVGVVRLKEKGGDGGHNGLKSTIQMLGTQAFPRLRFGIDHPVKRNAVTSYVLSPPLKHEWDLFDLAFEKSLQVLPLLLEGAFQKAMNYLHTQGIE